MSIHTALFLSSQTLWRFSEDRSVSVAATAYFMWGVFEAEAADTAKAAAEAEVAEETMEESRRSAARNRAVSVLSRAASHLSCRFSCSKKAARIAISSSLARRESRERLAA